MDNLTKIAVDAMGGENSPTKVIKGIEIHNWQLKNFFIIFLKYKINRTNYKSN